MNCPACDTLLEFPEDEGFDEGDTVDCDECAAVLIVTSVDPLAFAVSTDDEDDEDDEEDLDDEDEEEEEV